MKIGKIEIGNEVIAMKTKRSYILNIALIIAISGISLYLSVGSEVSTVFKTISGAHPFWLFVLGAIMVLYYVFDGIATMIFSRFYKKDYTLKEGFVNGLVGTLFSGLTPSSSGGQFAQVFVFNNQGISPAISSSILLMCFISYQIVIMGFTAVIMLVDSSYFLDKGVGVSSMAALGFLINAVVTILLFAGAKSRKFQDFIIDKVVYLLSKTPIVKDYESTCFKIQTYFGEFREQMNVLQKNKKALFQTVLCNIVKLTIMYSTPFFACLALGIKAPISLFVQFLGLASIINLINTFLPIPGASGGSEGCYMILFGFLGRANASSSMFVWRFFSFYFGLILGMIVFIVAKDTKRKDD